MPSDDLDLPPAPLRFAEMTNDQIMACALAKTRVSPMAIQAIIDKAFKFSNVNGAFQTKDGVALTSIKGMYDAVGSWNDVCAIEQLFLRLTTPFVVETTAGPLTFKDGSSLATFYCDLFDEWNMKLSDMEETNGTL